MDDISRWAESYREILDFMHLKKLFDDNPDKIRRQTVSTDLSQAYDARYLDVMFVEDNRIRRIFEVEEGNFDIYSRIGYERYELVHQVFRHVID